MFKFLKSKTSPTPPEVSPEEKIQSTGNERISWLDKLKNRLSKTRHQLTENLTTLFRGKKRIDQELMDDLETILITSDIGMKTSQEILERLTQQMKREEIDDPQALLEQLKLILTQLLTPCAQPLNINARPYVLLMTGVNGAGKTTSIAKIAHFYKEQNYRVMLAAGDTFRAAAIEQLQNWGARNDVPVIAQHSGADSASVIFDAMEAAKARNYDLLIADTAGRLHTQSHLMQELAKIKRVIQKHDPTAPHETMLVLDATMGQNGIHQARQFHETIGLTGISLTKLDGTAKGGMIFAIANELKLPIRFIGIGENIDDLRPFQAQPFVDALFHSNQVKKSLD